MRRLRRPISWYSHGKSSVMIVGWLLKIKWRLWRPSKSSEECTDSLWINIVHNVSIRTRVSFDFFLPILKLTIWPSILNSRQFVSAIKEDQAVFAVHSTSITKYSQPLDIFLDKAMAKV